MINSMQLDYKEAELLGSVQLERSKSISNRVLMVRALCSSPFDMEHLSQASDTKILASLLWSEDDTLYAGDAGTSFRFLTAYLCTRWTNKILTGSARMLERPIGPLVEALIAMGAQIEYLESPGFPPISIKGTRHFGQVNEVTVDAKMSSQFVSALMLIAPSLPDGLRINLQSEPASATYLLMTKSVMEYFAVKTNFSPEQIVILPQKYQAKDISIEADWSAASYFYAMAALSANCDIQLEGLIQDSWQGDQVVAIWMEEFGVTTSYTQSGAHLIKTENVKPEFLEIDFGMYPDLAQTMVVLCAALGIPGLFYGLETLTYKETDRILALKTELAKMNVKFYKASHMHSKKKQHNYFVLEGKAIFPDNLQIETYGDHRMAMAFAPLALLHPIEILDPTVVKKSFPQFWQQMDKICSSKDATHPS
ncbi:MAG: 3-phosphoshikimate 1-carboxyvinyltransferase [Saprospiraceae bacterium]